MLTKSIGGFARPKSTKSCDIFRHFLELLKVADNTLICPGLAVVGDVPPDKVGGQHGHVVGQTPVLLQQLRGLTLQQTAGLLVLLEHLHRVKLRLCLILQQTISPARAHLLDSLRGLRHCGAQATIRKA